MSNEIAITLAVQVEKGYLKHSFSPGKFLADLGTARRGGTVQTIGTTVEVIAVGDVSAPRLGVLRNLDTTNFVTIGPQSSTTSSMEPMLKLSPGQFVLLWLDPSVVLMALADTAAVPLQVDIFET